jgi:ferredoxin
MANLRETTARLLAEGTVQLVLGWEQGTLPLRTTPLFAREAGDAERLVYDPTCDQNLSGYLGRIKEQRVALLTRPCEARALVEGVRENRIARERVLAIGLPCSGMISRRALASRLADRVIREGRLVGDRLVVVGDGWREEFPWTEVRDPACNGCRLPDRGIYWVAPEAADPPAGDRFAGLDEWTSLSPEQRRDRFRQAAERCIACYACRQACPMCDCAECFTDRTAPALMGPTADPSEAMLFHLVRAMHLAGRCVDCGACVRACPVGVDLRHLHLALEREAAERFDHCPGVDPAARPLVGSFRPDDREEFIL